MLPEHPDLDWLRKQAKRRLEELRQSNPAAQLADAQFALAKEHGFASWRALKAHIDSLSIDGQLVEAARSGDVAALARLLDEHPDRVRLRARPYEWSLLHFAAQHGRLDAVNLLLARGIDVNVREKGDDTYAMHWAAAAGHLDVVRRLADAGGDVIGHGDDHALEVIGWATCWQNYHAHVAEFLVSRGARHHIFSAVALDLDEEVRRIVAASPAALNSRLTHSDADRTPLHHAVLNDRPRMVALLLELGADPLAADESGMPAAVYATSPDADLALMERIRAIATAEFSSAERGVRPPKIGLVDFAALVALGDWDMASRALSAVPGLIASGGAAEGSLHVMAKRGDVRGVRWLLEQGADPNGRWGHWDAGVTPLHLAAAQGHAEVVRQLLAAGADPSIRDSKHDGDAAGWAEYGRMPQHPRWREIVAILQAPR